MVAGGFSFNAMAVTPGTADKAVAELKGGEFIQLASGDFVLTTDEGALKFAAAPDLEAKTDDLLSTIDASLWKVIVKEESTLTGKVNTYKFQNKATGAFLSVKLQTNKKNTGKGVMDGGAASKVDGAGNAVWLWDATAGLYAASGDSVFYFATAGSVAADSPLSLQSAKATTISGVASVSEGSLGALAPLTAKTFESDEAITMSVAQFNKFLKNGKLYFNGENVSSTETNVLTANSWEALAFAGDHEKITTVSAVNLGTTQKFFLTNGTEVKKKGILPNDPTAYDKDAEVVKKNFLLVDYSFYNASTSAPVYNVLKVDTLAYEPTYTTADGLVAADKNAIDARSIYSKYHPSTAVFSAKYYVANDSIVLKAEYKPKSIDVATTLVELGKVAEAAAKVQNSNSDQADVKALVAASSVTFASSTGNNGGAFDKNVLFTDDAVKFAAEGASGTAKKGSELIENVKAYVESLNTTGDTDAAKNAKAAKKAVEAYLNAIAGLKTSPTTAQKLTSSKFVENKNFCDGVNALTAEAATNGEVILRQLSKTKVLTISNDEAGDIALLIQPYATKPGIGGDAEIAEGVYFIKDMRTLDAEKVNAGYGFFYNQTPVGPTYVAAKEDIAKEQAFNPYAQFVIEKAAGTEKGNYLITNLGLGDETAAVVASGVTNKVSDGVYAIGTDTFSIVAATTDLEDLDEHMGYKYISNADYLNNKFTITSAADVLFGQTIVMRSDSSLKVAEGEMLFTLKPQNAVPFGYNEALEYVPVTIMNADSAYIAYDAAKGYFFTNGKTETASGIAPKEFRLIAVDTDSTYVLYDGTNKMVVSTQYKTISAGAAATERNDLFIVKKEAAPASYKSLPKHVRIQAANTDYVAVNSANQGVAVREGDLKAAYDNLDFIFWLDTAQYENAETYKYYITKGVKAEGEVAASRLYMWSAQDSTSSKNTETFKYGNDNVRVLFRTASIMTKDTLFVPTMDAAAKIDTVSYKANKESADGLKHAVKGGLDKFQFSFEFASKDAENEYNIVSLDGGAKKYVHSLNGVLVMGGEKDALVVNVLDVTPEDEAATGNETINAEGVKVIAANGGVQIIGAQGKKVVITNILGQTVANTVLSSDNATIAAPAGVVVVAVEGEEAVKAIVK